MPHRFSKPDNENERLGDGPIEPRHHDMMNQVAHTLDKIFNPDHHLPGVGRQVGFCLMVFDFSEGTGRCNYISNAMRPDVVALLEHQLARFKGDA